MNWGFDEKSRVTWQFCNRK